MKLQNNVNQSARNLGNMLIVSLNHKLELVILKLASDKCVVVANDDVDKANISGNYFSGVYTLESEGKFEELPPRFPAVSYKDVAFSQEAMYI